MFANRRERRAGLHIDTDGGIDNRSPSASRRSEAAASRFAAPEDLMIRPYEYCIAFMAIEPLGVPLGPKPTIATSNGLLGPQ